MVGLNGPERLNSPETDWSIDLINIMKDKLEMPRNLEIEHSLCGLKKTVNSVSLLTLMTLKNRTIIWSLKPILMLDLNSEKDSSCITLILMNNNCHMFT